MMGDEYETCFAQEIVQLSFFELSRTTFLFIYNFLFQYDLYCDTEHLNYLTTSLLFIGWGIGSVISGWFADRLVDL